MMARRNGAGSAALDTVAISQPLSNVADADVKSERDGRRASVTSAATELALVSGYILLLVATPIAIGGLALTRWMRSRFHR